MMKYLNLIVCLTWLCFMSCDNEINPLQPQAEEAYIRFDVIEEEWPTKGTTTDGTSIRDQSLGVLAYRIDGTDMAYCTPSLMYNTQVSMNNGAWTYNNVKKWPTSGTVNFFAYTPYDDMTGTGVAHFKLSDKSAKGYPSITYRMNDQSNNHRDLLVASALGRTKEGGVVPFNFKHALARIHFTAKLKEDCTYSNVKITQVSIKSSSFKNVGTLTFSGTAGGFSWSNPTSDGISTDILMSDKELSLNPLKTDDYQSVTQGGKGYLFLIPQTTALALKVYYTFTDESNQIQNGISTVTLDEIEYKAEKAYNCQFELNPQPMTDGIPGEYTKLDALKNNSNGYILLGISPNGNDMGVTMRIQYNGSGDSDVYPLGVLSTLGNGTSSNLYSRRFYFPANNNSYGFQCGWNNKYGIICSTLAINDKHVISYNYQNDKKIRIDSRAYTTLSNVKEDGVSVTEEMTTEKFFEPVVDSNLPICLFGLTTSVSESGTTYTIAKNWRGTIYEVWISKGEADILHLKPVQHSNGTYGMYDVIGNDFYPCQNGNFTAIPLSTGEGTTE